MSKNHSLNQIPEDLNLALKWLRTKNSLTQKELANLVSNNENIKLSSITYSQYERNIRTPSYIMLKSILNVLDSDFSQLNNISKTKPWKFDFQKDYHSKQENYSSNKKNINSQLLASNLYEKKNLNNLSQSLYFSDINSNFNPDKLVNKKISADNSLPNLSLNKDSKLLEIINLFNNLIQNLDKEKQDDFIAYLKNYKNN